MASSYGVEAEEALADIVRVSRELGSDPSLVLHGGGNTSIKATGSDVTGEEIPLIFVKGSGWDLATIEPAGFAPLRRGRLEQLLQLEELDDPKMVNELRQASLDASAPTASVEALLHGYLPGRVVLHSHADAIVALTDRDVEPDDVAALFGEGVLVLPYVLPGFALARLAAGTDVTGVDALVLSNHGLFTFGEDPDETLARHLEIVARAQGALGDVAWGADGGAVERAGDIGELANLRQEVSLAAGRPMFVQQSSSGKAAEYARRPRIAEIAARGTATPEHVLYTKRTPLIGRDVAAYGEEYRQYFERNRVRAPAPVEQLDPAPRVILDTEFGMLIAADAVNSIRVAHDITLHTIDVVDAADALGGYASLDESNTFDIEYWSLEQAKLAKRKRATFAGEVTIVTGAASSRGRAVVHDLLAAGAAVVGIDADAWVAEGGSGAGWRAVVGDVNDPDVISRAVDTAVRDFGGIDMVVILTEQATPAVPVASLDDTSLQEAWESNAMAVARILRATHPFLQRALRGGRVVYGATDPASTTSSALAATKAAAEALVEAARREWAPDIRVSETFAPRSLIRCLEP